MDALLKDVASHAAHDIEIRKSIEIQVSTNFCAKGSPRPGVELQKTFTNTDSALHMPVIIVY